MAAQPLWPVALCTLAVGGLLWAEWRGLAAGIWLAKTLASSAFIVAALLWGALESGDGQLVLLALAFSWLGDLLLILRKPACFLLGLACFLAAHLAFSAAFLTRPQAPVALAFGALAMAGLGAYVLRWLWPHLNGRFRPAVGAYVVAISLMVALASGAALAVGSVVVVGAVAFAVSDILVARHQFVVPSFVNKALGLPLYYAGQLMLTATVRWPG